MANGTQKKREPKLPFLVLPRYQRGKAGGLTPAMSSITRTTWQL